jgi:predicted type IV restriction endonuclease
MPLNEIPKHLTPEVRSLIEAALEDAWQELNKDGTLEATPARNKLRSTMVALASVGETEHRKLKWCAIHAWRRALEAQQSSSALHARTNGMAA